MVDVKRRSGEKAWEFLQLPFSHTSHFISVTVWIQQPAAYTEPFLLFMVCVFEYQGVCEWMGYIYWLNRCIFKMYTPLAVGRLVIFLTIIVDLWGLSLLENVYLLIMFRNEPSQRGPRRWVSDVASSCVSAPSRGSYRFERPNGTFFDVRIPPFSLESKKDEMPNGFLPGPFSSLA